MALLTNERAWLYRSAFEFVGVGIVIATLDGRFVKVNAAFAEMLGYAVATLEGASVTSLTHPDDRQSSLDAGAALLAGRQSVLRLEKRYMHRDGHLVWVEVATFLFRDPSGNPCHFISCVQDLTARKQAEADALESQHRLNFALSKSCTGSWVFDLETHHATSTTEHGKIFGYDAAPQDWSYERFLEHVVDEDRLRVEHATRKAIAAGKDWSIECRIRRLDGAVRWIWATGGSYFGSHGRSRQAAGVVQDITHRKRTEEDNSRLEAQLLQAQRLESVGRFAGGVAHDFNNMLGVILGNVELAASDLPESSRIHADLIEIRKAAQRSADLIARLLAFARQQPIEPRVLNPNDVIFGMLRLLQRLIGEDIVVKWRPSKEVWEIKLDPSQMDQILANLCVNARDAIAGVGNIIISTTNLVVDGKRSHRAAGHRAGEFVCITVSDDGCGMSTETLEQIFEPFFTTKQVGEGTGLGLAVVYGIVSQNGGFVDVKSAPNQGTSFMIHLPRSDAADAGPASTLREDSPHRGKETILLVEDEPAMLMTTERLLETLGYRVIATRTPTQALALAARSSAQIHLLLTDVVMPEMNGKELAKRLQATRPDIKQLFMSGHTGKVTLTAEALLLQKPFTRRTLGTKIRAALDARSTTQEQDPDAAT